MNYDQFKNMSCYEEFDMQCTLAGISKIDALRRIGHLIDHYYFFISKDGIFNWFDLKGNHIKDPGILKELKEEYVPKNITKCIVPNSVTYIGDSAFYNCIFLKEITIPNSVIRIDRYTFYDCASLTSITIPDSVKQIGDYAFSYCDSLTSITISNNINFLGYRTFWYCDSLKEVIFKGKTLDEVKQMENYPFKIKDESITKCES